MPHKFIFTGHSDDVVVAASSGRDINEYYSTYYRMSNGALVKAEFGPDDDPEHPGWKITCDHPSAIRIPAPGDEVEHGDPRIPDWYPTEGHCDVLILEAEKPLSIIEYGDKPPPEVTPERSMALLLTKEINRDFDEEIVLIGNIIHALKRANLQLCRANIDPERLHSWQAAALTAFLPSLGITADPDSLRGKTFVLA